MLRALYERGIVPDLLVATSVGAVNAAFLASRLPNVATADEFAGVWCGIRRSDVFPANPIAGFLGFLGHRNSLVRLRARSMAVRWDRESRSGRLAHHTHACVSSRSVLNGE